MIDFRYHLVSLISVFLALAVGIALGAGPLQESIGDTLTGQVEQLRTEQAELRAELDAAQADVDQLRSALDDVAPELLGDVLGGRRVAVVEIEEVAPEVLAAVTERLEQGGATVTAVAQVTDDWTDPARATFRRTLAGTLVEYLDPQPPEDAGTGRELAEALAQGLTTAAPGEPDVLGEPAGILLQLLQEGGLVTLEGDVTTPADAVVVLAGPTVSQTQAQAAADEATQDPAQAEQDGRREAVLDAAVEVAAAAQDRSAGAVVAGGDLVEPGVLERLRVGEASAGVSTVESVHDISGQIAVPLALAAHINGIVGHYGTSAAADAAMPPRVVLPPVERAVVDVPPTDVPPAEAPPTDAAADPLQPGTQG